MSNKIINNIVPVTLKSKCMILARRAFTEVPMDEINAVTHDPMFEPNMM